MTYSTLSIRLYSKSVVGFALTSATAASEPVADLNDMAQQCGPYRLADWAKRHNLDVFYVDNCWVRVPVSQSDLTKFARDVLEKPDIFKSINTDHDDGSRYVIEAEEF